MGQDQTKKDDMGKDEMKSKKAKKAWDVLENGVPGTAMPPRKV
jgi:hypothetical protein